ncbi:MAG: YceI family protein [Proteobacteria bacterium]|nr:MAG: YceI family protein [Pseudomonadota bacterium]
MRLNTLSLVASFLVSSALVAAPAKFDKSSGSFEWLGEKNILGDSHTGTLQLKSGNFDLAAKKGEFVIDMESIKNTDLKEPSKRGKLEGHLKGSDFFDVANNKEAKFVVKDIVKDPSGKDKYTVKGDMTLRGKTNEEIIPATITDDGKKVAIKVENFELNRRKYGINYQAKPEKPADKTADSVEKVKKSTQQTVDKVAGEVGDKWIKDEIKLSFDLKSI